MSRHSQYLYVRIVNPGTPDEYMIFGPSPADVSDIVVGENESLSPVVARYSLVGKGIVTSPIYVESTTA